MPGLMKRHHLIIIQLNSGGMALQCLNGGPTCAPKRLDGVELALLHLGGFPSLDNGHTLAIVDHVGPDVVPTQVAAALYLVGLAINLALIGFHHLLDGCPDVTEPHIDPSFLDACRSVSVGALLQGTQARTSERSRAYH